jgi:hypothetical protein
MGCGVTAFTEQDVLNILKDRIFRETGDLDVQSLVADIDLTTLDSGHVLPNIGDVTIRGVWFPTGY